MQVQAGAAKASISAKQVMDPLLQLMDSGSAVPEEFVKTLAPDVFIHLVKLLQITYPGKRCLLILDNLSAVVEGALGKLRGNALLDICDRRFRDLNGVHLVLGWKADPGLSGDLEQLMAALRQYRDTNAFEHLPIVRLSDAAIEEWLREFDWFRNASSEDQQRLVREAGGLPMVVEQWREEAQRSEDGWRSVPMERAAQIAADVAAGHFEGYRSALVSSPHRELLFQMAASPQALYLHLLQDLTGWKTQEIKDRLQTWVDYGLLAYREDNRGTWAFMHERKQEFTFAVLRERLVDHGHEPADTLIRCFLERVGFGSTEYPDAGVFLATAWKVAINSDSQYWDRELLSSMVSVIYFKQPAPPTTNALQTFPTATRFLAFHAIPEWKLPMPELDGLPRGNIGKGLVNACGIYGGAQDWPAMHGVLTRLEALAECYPNDPEMTARFADALLNATNSYVGAQQWRGLDEILGTIESLTREHSNRPEVALRFAQALVSAGSGYGSVYDWFALKGVLKRVESLASYHPDHIGISLLFATGLFNASTDYGLALKWDALQDVLAKLESLAERHRDHDQIVLMFAHGLFNASSHYGKAQVWRALQDILTKLKSLADHHLGHDEVVVAFARGLVNASGHYSNAQEEPALQIVQDELQSLAYRHHDHPEVVRAFAMGLSNASLHYGNAHDWPALQGALARLESLADRHPDSHEIVVELATGLFNAGKAYARANEEVTVTDIIAKLRGLRPRLPESLPAELKEFFQHLSSLPPDPGQTSA